MLSFVIFKTGIIQNIIHYYKEKKIYEAVIKTNTDSAYIAYLNKHADRKFVKEVDSIFWKRIFIASDFDFYLENIPKIDGVNEKHISVAKDSLDEIFWRGAIISRDYQKYIDNSIKHNSKYYSAAKDSIEHMKWGTDAAAWDEANKQNTSLAYNTYLILYPNGKRVRQAKKLAIDREVDDIIDSQDYGQLPAMDKISQGEGKISNISAFNNTSYTLTLRYSGIESKSISISPYTRRTITLTNGNYRVAASVNAYNVRNYAGTENLTGDNYFVEYYISHSTMPSYEPQYIPKLRYKTSP